MGEGQRRTAGDHVSPAGNPAISGQVPRPVALRPRLAAGLLKQTSTDVTNIDTRLQPKPYPNR
jgi:hypothetical protein